MEDNSEKLKKAVDLANKCNAYLREAKFDKASEYAAEALRIKEEIYGDKAEELMEAYGLAGLAYSLSAYQRAGSTQLGEERYITSDKHFALSLYYYSMALEISQGFYGEESTQTARIYSNMGSVYRLMDDDWQEEEYYIRAIGIYSELAERVIRDCGEYSPQLADIYENLSMLYKNMDCTKEMLMYIEKAEKIYNKTEEYEHNEGCDCGCHHKEA